MEPLKIVEDLIDDAKEYVNVRVDEAKLTVAEKTSKAISVVIAGAVVSVVFLISLLFFSASASYALGNWLGGAWLGFLIVGGLYLLTALLVLAMKERWIRLPVMNALIRQLFKKSNRHEEN